MNNKGRPTANPKTERFEVRISEEEKVMLEYCREITGKSKSDIFRMGVRKIYDELKTDAEEKEVKERENLQC